MCRNLSKRVEVVTPVFAREAREKLWEVLDICLRDRRQTWVLGEDGTYSQMQPLGASEGDGDDRPEEIGTHATLMELARRRME
jgi:polyphosphate kinase